MKEADKIFLESNRIQLKHIENGSIKGVSLPEFFRIITDYWEPHRGGFSDTIFSSAADLIKSTYMRYEEHIERTPVELLQQAGAILEANRHIYIAAVTDNGSIGSVWKDMYAIMVKCFDPYYIRPDNMNTDGIIQLVKDVYRYYDAAQGIEATNMQPAAPEEAAEVLVLTMK